MTYHDADSAPAEGQGKLDGAPAEGSAKPDESDGTADIEEAMRQCERLLLQLDAGLRRIRVTEALWAGVSAVVALASVLSAVDSGGSPTAWIAAFCGGGVVISVVVLFVARLLSQVREQVIRDALIMTDIVSVQRELIPLISREEKWSPARLFLMQKRLEQFPVDVDSIGRRGRGSL
jgi:hypothetical protein